MKRFAPLIALACAGCFDFGALSNATSGASHCDALGTSVFFCDGLEAPSIDTTRWVVHLDPMTASIVSDGTKAARGARAAHFSAPMTAVADPNYYAKLTLAGDHVGVPTPSVHARIFVWVSAALAGNGSDLLDIYTDQPFGAIKVGTSTGGNVYVELDNIVPVGSSGSPRPPTHLPTDRWTCLEVGFDVAAGAGTMRIWIDDTEQTNLRQDSLIAAVPTGFNLNVQSPFPNGVPPLDVWYDEVVLDGGPIGCAK